MKAIAYTLPAAIMLMLAACSKPADEATVPTATSESAVIPSVDVANVKQVQVEEAEPVVTDDNRFAGWAGKWIGPEGMYVTVKTLGDDRFELEMQSDLDTVGTYSGAAEDRGIRFLRNGESLLLYRSTGDETGLKYLAGKKECLMVKSGEGYCRD